MSVNDRQNSEEMLRLAQDFALRGEVLKSERLLQCVIESYPAYPAAQRAVQLLRRLLQEI